MVLLPAFYTFWSLILELRTNFKFHWTKRKYEIHFEAISSRKFFQKIVVVKKLHINEWSWSLKMTCIIWKGAFLTYILHYYVLLKTRMSRCYKIVIAKRISKNWISYCIFVCFYRGKIINSNLQEIRPSKYWFSQQVQHDWKIFNILVITFM